MAQRSIEPLLRGAGSSFSDGFNEDELTLVDRYTETWTLVGPYLAVAALEELG